MLDQSVRKGSTKSSLSQGSWVAMGNCRSGLHVCTQSCKARPDTWNHGNLPSAKVAKSCKDAQFWSISLRKRVTVDGSATCCYSWETELVGRAKKGVMPTAPSVPRRSPGGAPVKRLQLLGQMLPHLSTKASIWWIQLLLIFCYFPGFVLSWEFAHKSRSWADSCPIVFQWPWHSRGGWVYRPDLWSASLLGLLAKIKV